MNYYYSSYNIIIDVDDSCYAVFNTISKTLILLDKDKIDHIDNLTDEELEYLLTNKFIHPNSAIEPNIVINDLLTQWYEEDLISIILITTMKCNLECVYCYEHIEGAKIGSAKKLDFEAVTQFINKVAENFPEKIIDVNFHGGEPLLIEKRIIKTVKELSKQETIKFTLTSNGTLFNESNISFINRYFDGIMVTLDGDEVLHNQRRPAKNKRSNSYKNTINGIRTLLSRTTGIVTLNVVLDDNNKGRIKKMLDDLKPITSKYPDRVTLSLSPALNASNSFSSTEYWIENIISIVDIMKHSIKNGFFKNNIFNIGGICTRESRYSFVIAPDNKVYSCITGFGEAKYFLGDIYSDPRTIIRNKAIAFQDENLLERCGDCKYITMCTGGCDYERNVLNQNLCPKEKFEKYLGLGIREYVMGNTN